MRGVRTVLGPVVAAALWAVPSAAQAGTETTNDPRGDVVAVTQGGGLGAAAPGRSVGDIRRARISYGTDEISGVIRFVDLERPRRRLLMGVDMRWEDAVQSNHGGLRVIATDRRPGGVARFRGYDRCEVRHRIDYARDVLTFSAPSSCLRGAPWVQARSAVVIRTAAPGASGFYDSAPDGYGPPIPLG